jgi:sulfatase maturation enzyme AslB (radical SAM superfamily)
LPPKGVIVCKEKNSQERKKFQKEKKNRSKWISHASIITNGYAITISAAKPMKRSAVLCVLCISRKKKENTSGEREDRTL